MTKVEENVHVYDANLDGGSALQDFFEGDSLTVATRFFRNKVFFQQLEEVVIPQLLQGGLAHRKIVHIWSAGCSDGRETYSLAVAVRRILDQLGHKRIQLQLRGSDLSRPQLDRARKGVYRVGPSDNGVFRPYSDFFTQLSPALWEVKDSIRRLVEFVDEDIAKVVPDEPYDLLVCSLVLLYYEPNYQKEILLHLLTTLRVDGFFYVAPVSSRWMRTQGFKPVVNGMNLYHRDQAISSAE